MHINTVIALTPDVMNRMKLLIEQSGMNKKQFAHAIGITPSAISEIFSGRMKNISQSMLLAMELKFGVNKTWLKTGEGGVYNPPTQIACPFEYNMIMHFRTFKPEFKAALVLICEALINKQEKTKERR